MSNLAPTLFFCKYCTDLIVQHDRFVRFVALYYLIAMPTMSAAVRVLWVGLLCEGGER